MAMYGKEGERMHKKAAVLLTAAALLVAAGTAVVLGSCSGGSQDETMQVLGPQQQAYVRQLDLAFAGGHAVIGLYDQEAALEFAERQPLAVQLVRQPEKIILPGLPDSVYARQDTQTLAPAIGDIVMDTQTKEVYICCRDMDSRDGRILLGHVVSGLELLSQQHGTFEAFAMTAGG